MPSNCRLCHGDIIAVLPPSPAVQSSAERTGLTPPDEVECHSHCLAFACPGCVAKSKETYNILNLENHVYDYHCDACMAVEPALVALRSAPTAAATVTSSLRVEAPAVRGMKLSTISEAPEVMQGVMA